MKIRFKGGRSVSVVGGALALLMVANAGIAAEGRAPVAAPVVMSEARVQAAFAHFEGWLQGYLRTRTAQPTAPVGTE